MAKTPAQRAAKHDRRPPEPVRSTGPSARLRDAGMARRQAAERGAPTGGNANLILIAAGAASAFLFWYLHLLTLGQLTQLSRGLAMPDSLVGGFNLRYIQDLKGSMSADALGQLQFVHKTAGTLFPIVFALTAALLIGLVLGRSRLRRVLFAVPVLFALSRIGANISVDSVLGAATPDADMVGWASFLVVASWLLLLLSLVAGAAAVVVGRRRRNQAAPGN